MKKRLLCLCLPIVLLISGCGEDSNKRQNTTDEKTSTSTSTTAPSNSTTSFETSTTTTTTPTVIFQPSFTANSTTTTTGTNSSASSEDTTTASSSQMQSETVLFKVTIRENVQRQPVANVVATIYTDHSVYTATTNASGVASVSLIKSGSYHVQLSHLPDGYVADTVYTFSGNIVNITIQKEKVRDESDHSNAGYKIGETMSNFTLTDINGNVQRLSDLQAKHKLIILDFWFVACMPCKESFPYFEAALQKYGEEIAIIAINPLDNTGSIQSFLQQYNSTADIPLTFPMAMDTCNLYQGFDVISYPTTVFLDANGRIMDIHEGMFSSEEAFFAEINKYTG